MTEVNNRFAPPLRIQCEQQTCTCGELGRGYKLMNLEMYLYLLGVTIVIGGRVLWLTIRDRGK